MKKQGIVLGKVNVRIKTMGEMADYARDLEERQEYDLYPDEDYPTNDEYFLSNLIKKYSDNRVYNLDALVSLVKSRVETGLISHPTVLGILSSFDKKRYLSGKQRDVLIKSLAYSDQEVHC